MHVRKVILSSCIRNPQKHLKEREEGGLRPFGVDRPSDFAKTRGQCRVLHPGFICASFIQPRVSMCMYTGEVMVVFVSFEMIMCLNENMYG